MAITNSSVVLPIEYGREVIRGVLGRSKALELGRRLPDMVGKTYKLNVFSNLPVSGWVKNQTTPVGAPDEIKNKPVSQLAWTGVDLVAEEIAVLIPISINTIKDLSNWIDLLPYVSEQVEGAFQEVIDGTAFFGINSPYSNFSGILAGATNAGAVVNWDGEAGLSFYNAINDAMEYVENSGYVPTAILGGPALNSAFRKTITALGILAGDQGEIGALPRHVDLTGGFDQSSAFAIVGDFRYFVYAFREEMEARVLEEATIVDPTTGSTLYNLAQKDMIAVRFTMRLGMALPNPVNRVNSTDKRYPFAVIKNAKYDGSGSL